MNSSIVNVLEIFNVATSLSSVGFSAGYNYDEANAEEFFDELIENTDSITPIFMGIMIIEEVGEKGNFIIVDGLQRITTLSLILSALCEGYKGTTKKNEDARFKIFTRYLTKGSDVKLQLTESEWEIYQKLVFSEELDEYEAQSNLARAYKLFLSKIKSRKIAATDLFKIISKIQFMVVFMDKSKVSPRELYQSLNDNKNDLSTINLITSFISQKFNPYVHIWNNIVQNYKRLDLSIVLRYFISDFLTVQDRGKIPNQKKLYISFKKYFMKMSRYQSADKILENVDKYSRFYLKIIQADFEDPEIQNQIMLINENNGQDSYSYLMEALDDFENSHICRESFLDILTTINSFLANRNENDSDTTINFASLSEELNKRLTLANDEFQFIDESKLTINEINQLSTFGV